MPVISIMKERLISFFTALIILFVFCMPLCRAQQVTTDLNIDTLEFAKLRASLRQQEKDREVLRQYFDSLFQKKEYTSIIQAYESKSPEQHLEGIVKYNLIAAHYFAGNNGVSQSLIQKALENYSSSGIGASTLLSENYTGYLYFLSVDENWKYIEKLVKEIALQAAIAKKDTEPAKEQQLFDFFIADQKNRLFHDYVEERKNRSYKFEGYKTQQAFDETAEGICKEIFEFYRKEGKLFSKSEVGELHYIQLVFLLHDSDLKRRAYYLEILDHAVAAGVFPIDKKLDFLIVNELIKANWENMTKVITEQESKLRVAYQLPNYRFSLVM